MIPMYYIYDTANAPEELTAKHPNAATYESITLFVTGATETSSVIKIVDMGFNHPFDEENTGLTAAQLDAMVDNLLSPDTIQTGAEVQISKVQANYLYETRFKPIEVIE